jgi:hypothetical protein
MGLVMPILIEVDSVTLWGQRSLSVETNVPGIFNFQVCCGSGGWPTPYEVGIYLDTDNHRCCIIDWPRPCKPIKFSCGYGEFVVHLDTATEDEIRSAAEVKAEFFHDD